jgi:hypothetical protein
LINACSDRRFGMSEFAGLNKVGRKIDQEFVAQ